MSNSLMKLGKRLAHCLRHSPESYNLSVDSVGAATVEDVCDKLNLTLEQLVQIVETDSKGRFVMSDGKIWAAQGHSIPVSVPLESYTSEDPLFHGTKKVNLPKILKEGLKPQSRNHVHLSKTPETATDVASRRSGESVILQISVAEYLQAGGKLFVSSNGVVLAEHIPAEYVKVV